MSYYTYIMRDLPPPHEAGRPLQLPPTAPDAAGREMEIRRPVEPPAAPTPGDAPASPAAALGEPPATRTPDQDRQAHWPPRPAPVPAALGDVIARREVTQSSGTSAPRPGDEPPTHEPPADATVARPDSTTLAATPDVGTPPDTASGTPPRKPPDIRDRTSGESEERPSAAQLADEAFDSMAGAPPTAAEQQEARDVEEAIGLDWLGDDLRRPTLFAEFRSKWQTQHPDPELSPVQLDALTAVQLNDFTSLVLDADNGLDRSSLLANYTHGRLTEGIKQSGTVPPRLDGTYHIGQFVVQPGEQHPHVTPRNEPGSFDQPFLYRPMPDETHLVGHNSLERYIVTQTAGEVRVTHERIVAVHADDPGYFVRLNSILLDRMSILVDIGLAVGLSPETITMMTAPDAPCEVTDQAWETAAAVVKEAANQRRISADLRDALARNNGLLWNHIKRGRPDHPGLEERTDRIRTYYETVIRTGPGDRRLLHER